MSLDYNMLPFDKHTLNFTMRLPSTDTSDKACFVTGLRNSTVVELPDLQLGAGWEDGDKPLIWDGLPEQARGRAHWPCHHLRTRVEWARGSALQAPGGACPTRENSVVGPQRIGYVMAAGLPVVAARESAVGYPGLHGQPKPVA